MLDVFVEHPQADGIECGPLFVDVVCEHDQIAVGDRPGLSGYAGAVGLVTVPTVVGALADGHLDQPDLVLLYLLAVVIAATRFGRGPSLVAATLSPIRAYGRSRDHR